MKKISYVTALAVVLALGTVAPLSTASAHQKHKGHRPHHSYNHAPYGHYRRDHHSHHKHHHKHRHERHYYGCGSRLGLAYDSYGDRLWLDTSLCFR
ncbi:MAG: hypothetical protein ABFS23_01700 [Pseudomonadota bacterium]